MKIKELTLHNFRGIKDLHLVFDTSHNVVVLVGINGVGKSSILDCIHFLLKYYEKVIDDNRGDSITKLFSGDDWLYIFYKSLLSNSDIHADSNNTINQIKIGSDYQEINWKIAQFRQDSDNDLWKSIHNESTSNVAEEKCPYLTNNYFYYLSNRRVFNLLAPEKIEAENIINFESFSEWFKAIESLENEQRLSDNIDYRHPVLLAVRYAVYSLLGKGYEKLTFKRAIDKMTMNKSGQEIVVDLLSDGEKSLLAMVGHLSRKLAENSKGSDNPLEASAIVLIDEIELHLHPEWQRMIIPRLTKTFPNCQFIVTTHSPQVLSHVDPECIHILDYDGDNVVVKRPENSYGLDSNRILEDILGVSKRPQEIQDRMLELFRTINNNDLASAKEIVKELGDRIGINEPELVKAEATIKRREIIGR
jgi:predicted ATP-binding protein involved in virulence